MACATSKCCFCAPLSLGLLMWAYIKLILTVVVLGAMSITFYERLLQQVLGLIETVYVCYVVLGLIFAVMLVLGLHYGNYKFLFSYYLFSMFEVLVGVSFLGFLIFSYVAYAENHLYYKLPSEIISLVGLTFANILLPVYFIVLIRSELLYIKAREDQTSVDPDIAVAREQDKKYDFVYADSGSNEAAPRMPPYPVEELEQMILQLGVKEV